MNNYISRAKYLWDRIIESNKNKKILDCASGNGSQTSQQWIEWGLSPQNIIAIDVNEDCLSVLSKLGVKTIRMDLEKESILEKFDEEKFDVIVCSETVEHLQKNTADKLLFDFLKVLNKNGTLVMTYPSKAYPSKDGKHNTPYGHCRQPNNAEIELIVEPFFEKKYSNKWFVTERHPHDPACFLMFCGKK